MLQADDENRVNIELSADSANNSLKQLAVQSGVEVVFASELVAGVRTGELRGEFTPLEAATQLLEGTGLSVEEDLGTKALIIGKAPDSNEKPVDIEPKNPVERARESDVVILEEYSVSTTLGRYAEETTSAGSKMPIETKDLPATVQIFNASSLTDHMAETLDDIYPYVVGLTKEAPISNGFNIRGFTAQSGQTQQNLQVDNLPGTASRYSSPSTVNIERLEIIKGPTSVLYGKLNPGGLINVVTKRPKQKQEANISTSISSYAGQFSGLGDDLSLKASVDFTGPIDADKHWLYRVIAAAEDLQSWRPYGYFKNYYFYPSLTYRWSEKTSLTAQVEVVREKRQYDNSIPYPPGMNPANLPAFDTMYMDPDTPEKDTGEAFSTSFQHLFANKWKLSVGTRTVAHTDSVRGYRFNQVFSRVTAKVPVSDSTLTRTFFERTITRDYNFVDANVYGDLGSDAWRHTLLFGINGGQEESVSDFPISGVNGTGANALKAINDVVNYYHPVLGKGVYPPAGTRIAPRLTEVRYNNMGAYVSDRMKIGTRWSVMLGVRYEGMTSNSRATTESSILVKDGKTNATLPSVGVLYEANEHVTVYLSTNKSFRPAPADNNVDENGRVDFPPEEGRQLEFGIKSQFFDRRLVTSFAAYQIIKENVLENTNEFTPDGQRISRIQGEAESQGFELECIWLPVSNWQLQAGLSFIPTAEITKSSNPIFVGRRNVNVPRISGSFWTRYNVPEGRLRGLGLGFGSIVQGKRLIGTPTTQTSAYESPGYTRFDVAVYYQLKQYNFAINISNLLDRSYIAAAGENAVFPADPRRVTLSASKRF